MATLIMRHKNRRKSAYGAGALWLDGNAVAGKSVLAYEGERLPLPET